jgi:hypothetical protein
MEDTLEQEEIRPLIFNYVFHFILFILVFLLHLIICSKLYWVSKLYYKLYLFGIYLGILYFLFPIFPIIIIIWKKFKKKIFLFLKKLTLAFLIISIILGLFISAIILINTIFSKTFSRECPFSITLSHLNYLFAEYYDKNPSNDDIKDLCKSRRCILDEIKENDNNKFPYKYLCNYNPIFDFKEKDKIYRRNTLNGKEITSDAQLNCDFVQESFMHLPLKHNELYKYLKLCYNLDDFYYCGRFDKPEKEYKLDNEDTCPDTSYIFLLYILCVLVILIDIIITMMPWGVEYISLKRIVRILSNMTRRKPNSHNSTQKSSVITNNNNEESFKKSKTQIIVLPSNNEEEIINVNKRKLYIQDNEDINNGESRNRTQINKNVQNTERVKINNSLNVFGRNEQNISTEMNNQNINNNLRSKKEINPVDN